MRVEGWGTVRQNAQMLYAAPHSDADEPSDVKTDNLRGYGFGGLLIMCWFIWAKPSGEPGRVGADKLTGLNRTPGVSS